MGQTTILIFPAGTGIGLEINQALQYAKDVRIIAAGDSHINHASYVCETYEIVPSVFAPGCLEALNALIARYDIEYIFPAHDAAMLFLIRHREQLNAKLLCPPSDISEITLYKSKTYAFFEGLLPVPKLYGKHDTPAFPLFAKRDRGEGSIGAQKIEDKELFDRYARDPDYILCEYLSGPEFTVDCLSDSSGLLFAAARERRRMRAGMAINSVLSSPERQQQCERFARIIQQKMGLVGAWFFQMKENAKGELVLMEIAPRIAGTMALNRVRGVNFPLLTLYAYQGKALDIMINRHTIEIDRGYINRYRHDIQFDTVFLDFDDTLYLRGQLVLDAVKFLFRCKNEKKKVLLLTRHDARHAEPLAALLTQFGLSGAFETILQVKEGEQKSDYIQKYSGKQRAIFIDDSFSERKKVADMCGIPTFDLSMLELLTDGKN